MSFARALRLPGYFYIGVSDIADNSRGLSERTKEEVLTEDGHRREFSPTRCSWSSSSLHRSNKTSKGEAQDGTYFILLISVLAEETSDKYIISIHAIVNFSSISCIYASLFGTCGKCSVLVA
jgi:hypothetical protein